MAPSLNLFKNIPKYGIFRKISTSSCIQAHWNKDWMPGPYPTTYEEHKFSADKYNIHPNEYAVYPKSDGYADYPKLSLLRRDLRDPYYPYDFPEHKRNFNEPIHSEVDLELIYDYDFSVQRDSRGCLVRFMTVFGALFGIMYLSAYIQTFQPVTEKQYPWTVKSYYTFDKIAE